MCKTLLVNVILYSILLICSCNKIILKDEFRQDPKVTRQFKMRCTRRFSPGVCAGHVAPVWTYVFYEHNCTERIGCANHFRGNRFKNYEICMKQCQGLAELYLKMLEVAENTTSSNVQLRKGKAEPTRVKITAESEKQEDYVLSQEEIGEFSYDEYEQGENESYSLVYKDLWANEEIFPPDVDSVGGEIRSQYDLFHP